MSPISPYGRPSDTMTTLPTITESNTLEVGEGGRPSTSDAGSGTESAAPGRMRLKQAVKSVMMLARTANAAAAFSPGPQRQRTISSDGTRSRRQTEPPALLKSSRVAALVPRLKSLETTQDLAAHSALVRHLQFSPNGKFLATSRYESVITCVLRIG